MKKFIIALISLLAIPNSMAQQQPQFTHYMYNAIAVNPAYAGSRGALAINGVNRNQWVGFEGGPQTTTLSVHSPLRNDKMGLGLSVMHDQAGWENFTYLYVDYSYTIQTSQDHFLSFGLKGGFSQYRIDEELFAFPDVMEDPFFQDQLNRWTPNVGAGVYYHTDNWYAGISSPRLITNDFNKESAYVALERNHYYMTGGYIFGLTPNTKLRASALTRYTKGSPLAVEGSAVFLFFEKLWLGASYRHEDAIGALADFKINNQLRVGYAYEYTVSDIRPYTSGSHEVILIYEFKYNFSKYKSPRYF